MERTRHVAAVAGILLFSLAGPACVPDPAQPRKDATSRPALAEAAADPADQVPKMPMQLRPGEAGGPGLPLQAGTTEGWAVAPGRISFSHGGYPTGGPKAAFATDLTAEAFELLDADGKVVLRKPLRTEKTRQGTFQVMDFTEHQAPGEYRLRAGGVLTRPFRIAPNVWRPTLWKAINFFYVERCGTAVEGVHDLCHADWQAQHNGKTIVINGGWHDAGDCSQGPVNTGEADFGMFDSVRKLRQRGVPSDAALTGRLLEEARWGLGWLMKTTFHDGYRVGWAQQYRWTNGVIGDEDDVTIQASREPDHNLHASAAEAVAANVLKQTDPNLARAALALAREDLGFGVERFDKQEPDHQSVEMLGIATMAAVEIYLATGEKDYADLARRWARLIVASQQQEVPAGLDVPITGWFHTDGRRREVLRYYHRCHEHAPVLALIALCQALPEDGDWMTWYSAVTLWSQYYQKPLAAVARPYDMLGNSVWPLAEFDSRPPAEQAAWRAIAEAGTRVGSGWYVRAFGVHPEAAIYRGNNGTLLTQTKALAAAAHLRGDLPAAQLCQEQLYWVLGRNPFRQSLMYGQGYDYPQMYSPMSGQIVGAIPVGIKTYGPWDVPFWPASVGACYKEVWVHTAGRWIWLMADLDGEPVVRGTAAAGRDVTLRQVPTGGTHHARADAGGHFQLHVPAGGYEVSAGLVRQSATFLPAGVCDLDLRPASALDLRVEQTTTPAGDVTITLHAAGSGLQEFSLRSHNLRLVSPAGPTQSADLGAGEATKIVWQAKTDNPAAPWVAVVAPAADRSRRLEATGLAEPLAIR